MAKIKGSRSKPLRRVNQESIKIVLKGRYKILRFIDRGIKINQQEIARLRPNFMRRSAQAVKRALHGA